MLLLRANTLALGHSGCRPLLVDRLLEFLRLGHPSGRARAGQRRGVRGPRAARPPRAAAHRSGRGGGPRHASCRRMLALREAGLEPLDARGQGRPGAPQRDPDDERDRGARPGRRGPPRPDRERRRRDERRGAARDGRRVRRRLPARPAASGPGRRRRRAPPPPARQRRSRPATTGTTHKVQDPYSLRCVPQVHGAVRDALDHLRRVLDIELNSATDNPLVFPGGGVADDGTIATGGGRVISGGNFHGEPIALALDFAKIALAELGSISERRTALLVDPRLNGGLPPFLAAVVRDRLGDDDLPVHGRRPRLGEQGPRPSRLGRLDPDEREPGGPRLDGLDLRAARPDGARARRADPRHRAARRRPGARPAAGDVGRRRPRATASPRR